MKINSEKIEDIIASMDRSADQLDVFSLRVAETSKQFECVYQDLKREVTLLRSTHKEIGSTIALSFQEQLPKLSEQTNKAVKDYITLEVQKLSRPIEKVAADLVQFSKTLEWEQKKNRRRIQKAGLAVTVAFCLGSVGTGFGIWYLFPQTTHNTFDFTSEQRTAMEHGTLLKFAMKKMSKQEQDKLWSLMGDSWKEYYDEMLAVENIEKLGRYGM